MMHDAGCLVHETGCWILSAGCLVLDAGCWYAGMLDAGTSCVIDA